MKIYIKYLLDSSHLKGLSEIVNDYFVRNPKSFSKSVSYNNISLVSNKNLDEKTKVKIVKCIFN